MIKLPDQLRIDKNIKDLTSTEILVICYDSLYCSECPLYLYDTHLCMEKYQELRKNLDVVITGLFRTDKNI